MVVLLSLLFVCFLSEHGTTLEILCWALSDATIHVFAAFPSAKDWAECGGGVGRSPPRLLAKP